MHEAFCIFWQKKTNNIYNYYCKSQSAIIFPGEGGGGGGGSDLPRSAIVQHTILGIRIRAIG